MGKPEVSHEGPAKSPSEEIRLLLNLETIKNNGLAKMIAEYVSSKTGLDVTPDKCVSELIVKPTTPDALCLLEINYMNPRTGRLAAPKDKLTFMVGRFRKGQLEFSRYGLGENPINKTQQDFILAALSKFGHRLATITRKNAQKENKNIDGKPSFDDLPPRMQEHVMENASIKMQRPDLYEKLKAEALQNAEELAYSFDDEYIAVATNLLIEGRKPQHQQIRQIEDLDNLHKS